MCTKTGTKLLHSISLSRFTRADALAVVNQFQCVGSGSPKSGGCLSSQVLLKSMVCLLKPSAVLLQPHMSILEGLLIQRLKLKKKQPLIKCFSFKYVCRFYYNISETQSVYSTPPAFSPQPPNPKKFWRGI